MKKLRVLLREMKRMCFQGHKQFYEREAEKDSESAMWPISVLIAVYVSVPAELRYLPLISTYIAVTLTTKNSPLGSTMSCWQEYRARAIKIRELGGIKL